MTLSFNGFPIEKGENIIFTKNDQLYFGEIEFIKNNVVGINVNNEFVTVKPSQIVKLSIYPMLCILYYKYKKMLGIVGVDEDGSNYFYELQPKKLYFGLPDNLQKTKKIDLTKDIRELVRQLESINDDLKICDICYKVEYEVKLYYDHEEGLQVCKECIIGEKK